MQERRGRWTTRFSARGHAYRVWEPEMPRIRDEYLNCVLYLYRSRHEAEEGINIGGSAFLVSVRCQHLPHPAGFAYAITNAHVIHAGACVVRVNTRDGRFDIFEFPKEMWHISETDDLAICVMPDFPPDKFTVRTIPRGMFVTERAVKDYNFGPGDEIILVGRFINQEGKERNIPSVRFGHISQMPFEPIEYDGRLQDSFLCEVKSIGGFSGSPVFLAPISDAGRPDGRAPPHPAWLLGVDWAHVQNWEYAQDDHGRPIRHIRIPSNTGMMAVVPAWKLDAFLDHPLQLRFREMEEEKEVRRRRAAKVSPDSAVVQIPATDENPKHREDFNSLLSAAVKKREPED